jgi:hypothetical protein
MAGPIKAQQAAAKARAAERENLEKQIDKALRKIRDDLWAAIEAGTVGLEDIGLSPNCLGYLRSHFSNWGDATILGQLLEWFSEWNYEAENDTTALLDDMRKAAWCQSWYNQWTAVPAISPREMEALLLYYTELDMDQIEMCMNVFVDQWEMNLEDCKSRSKNSGIITAIVAAAMTAGAAYGLAPYFVPGMGYMLEEIGDDVANTADDIGAFYSGSPAVQRMAEECSDAITIMDTEFGREAALLTEGMDPFSDKYIEIWDNASRLFAQSRSGIQKAFIDLQGYRGALSTFGRVEWPELMANPNVPAVELNFITEYGNIIQVFYEK